jgi:hypothetical protein
MVGVTEIERFADAVIARAVEGNAMLREAAEGIAEGSARRIPDGQVIQPGGARCRGAASAVPGVEPDVVVIPAGAQEGGAGHPLGDLEAEHAAVERNRPIEIRHFEVHVPDVDVRMNALGHKYDDRAGPAFSGQPLQLSLGDGGDLATKIPLRLAVMMAEVLVEFSDPVVDADGITYTARACGSPLDAARWQGWIEFVPADGGESIRSGRETTQPNRTDTLYWATGLTAVYLQGALERAQNPLVLAQPRTVAPPAHDEPAPDIVRAPVPESILNPFSVYRKGEALLRRQLGAFSVWHLVNIVRAHDLSPLGPEQLNRMTAPELIDLTVNGVRNRANEDFAR